VGEVVLGKKVGNKAPMWGAIAGTLPDLDVLLNPFVDDLEGLLLHRTFTHSLFVLTLLAPLLGWTVAQLYKKNELQATANVKDWTWLFFWALVTHPLLDAFTNYGTMLFYPFSHYRVELNTIFIIDPLYTLPLLVGSLTVLFLRRESARRRHIIIAVLLISSAYLGITCINKYYVGRVIQANIEAQQWLAAEYMSAPAPFTNILWSVIVKTEAGFQVGYYSLLDDTDNISFKFIPQNEDLLLSYTQKSELAKSKIDRLITFTKGFFAIQPYKTSVLFNDLRFGISTGWFDLSKNYIFSFVIQQEGKNITITQNPQALNPTKEDLHRLWQRIKGKQDG
jgi:inner membrane protein